MKTITLDASNWKDVRDMCRAIYAATGAPAFFSCSMDGMLEALIWNHALEEDFPPYTIVVRNVAETPPGVRRYLVQLKQFVAEALAEFPETYEREFHLNFELM